MSVKIALLGFGTVASGVPFLLKENHEKITQAAQDEIEIAKVLVRDDAEMKSLQAAGHDYNFVTNVDEIIEDKDIAIVVELMGRIEPARTFITKALEASDKITRILGVVNGTSNFMMTKMVEEGWTYEDALAEAQRLGYAESDPTNDVEGIDAAYKMVILSQFAFGMNIQFDQVGHKGISQITPQDVSVAQSLGYVIKLVGSIVETESGIAAEVTPTFLPKQHPLAGVNDVMNAVYVESIGIGESMYYGPGAGQKPTATSVVADIVRIVRRLKEGTIGKAFNEYSRPLQLAKPEDVKNNYYFSIKAPDATGQILRLAEIFNAEGASFNKILQEESDGQFASVVIITHQVNQTQFKNLVEKLDSEANFELLNTFKVLGE